MASPSPRAQVGSKTHNSVSKSAPRVSKHKKSAHDSAATAHDVRHRRVWKACERCRMKKTRCDGMSPCARCKDDDLVCTAGSRKKVEPKQVPPGYTELLENNQHALIATCLKLYSMVRAGQEWDLGEPPLNDAGTPVVHHIVAKLGCIRQSSEFALPLDDAASSTGSRPVIKHEDHHHHDYDHDHDHHHHHHDDSEYSPASSSHSHSPSSGHDASPLDLLAYDPDPYLAAPPSLLQQQPMVADASWFGTLESEGYAATVGLDAFAYQESYCAPGGLGWGEDMDGTVLFPGLLL